MTDPLHCIVELESGPCGAQPVAIERDGVARCLSHATDALRIRRRTERNAAGGENRLRTLAKDTPPCPEVRDSEPHPTLRRAHGPSGRDREAGSAGLRDVSDVRTQKAEREIVRGASQESRRKPVRNTSGLLRGGPKSPGRPKGSVNAPKVKQLVYRCLEKASEEAYQALLERFKSKKTVQEALEFVAKLTGELKPQGGPGGGAGRPVVIFVGGGPNALTPEVFRQAAAARLAQRALNE